MGESNIKTSIIIPVYNVSAFIRECIDSVRSQTMTDGLECILIDDCSTDNSLEIIQSIINGNVNGNVNFFLLRQERNQGPSAARNRGIREAKGEYVIFLDADDTITPDCIELLYGLAKQHDADYVQGRYESEIKDNKDNRNNTNIKTIELLNSSTLEPSIPAVLTDRREIKRLLLNHNKIQFTPHNRLVRRQMIIDNGLFFNEEIRVREDFLWMTFVAKYVKKFASCDKVTYVRGFNEDSLTNNINKEREEARIPFNLISTGIIGLLVGFSSGLLGVGGGIFIIAILTGLLGFSMIEAIGTSSIFISLTAIGGFLSYIVSGWGVSTFPYSIGYVSIINFLLIACFSVPFASLGAKYAHRIPQKKLKILFSILVLYMALKMLGVLP